MIAHSISALPSYDGYRAGRWPGSIDQHTTLQSTSRSCALCTTEMIGMKDVTSLLSKLETVSSNRPEFAYFESKLGELDPDIRSVTLLQDTFVVNDLLEGYSYTIARSKSGYQLTFALGDGDRVVVAVEPCDIDLVAQKIAKQLVESGNRILRLELEGPLNSTGGL